MKKIIFIALILLAGCGDKTVNQADKADKTEKIVNQADKKDSKNQTQTGWIYNTPWGKSGLK